MQTLYFFGIVVVMSNIKLIKLSSVFDEDIYNMLQTIEDRENGFSNPAYKLNRTDYRKWLKEQEKHSKGKNLPENWVPYTTYILFDKKIPVGFARIRHESSKHLETIIGAGNLGYAIAKDYRRKGYGTTLFSLLLKECKTFGYEKIKLFPHKDNTPTIKIMLKHGGKVLGDFNEEKAIIEIEIK